MFKIVIVDFKGLKEYMKMWNTKSIIPVFLEKVRYADGKTQAFPLGCDFFFSVEGGDTQDI